MSSPAAMTFDSLVTDIKTYAERSDDPFVSQIPRFIMLAENRIASEVRGLGLLKVVSGSMDIGNPQLAKPSRWRETASFRITVGTEKKALVYRTFEYCSYFAPDTSVTGVPRFYADYGYEHFFIVPSPVLGYAFELMYFERPEPLSSSNQVSWTTQYAPQLILYAALLETQPFLKTDERIPVFQGFYNQAKDGVQNEAKRRVLDRSTAVRDNGN